MQWVRVILGSVILGVCIFLLFMRKKIGEKSERNGK
jgi:hypothetical protein